MRIILKPGGVAALLLGLSILVSTSVYSRYARRVSAEQVRKQDIASSRSADLSPLANQTLESVSASQRYWLVNRGTKLALDIWEKSAFDGAWTCPQPVGASVTQQWRVQKNADDGSVSFVNVNTGKALQSADTKDEGNISQGTLTQPASFSQRWVLQPDGDYYYLSNRNNQRVLGIGTQSGTTTEWGQQQKKEPDDHRQQWQLVQVR